LENYRALLEDTQFWHSLFFILKYALFVNPCLFILAFILALLINGAFAGLKLFRSLYLAPVVISLTFLCMVWLWIYTDLFVLLYIVSCSCVNMFLYLSIAPEVISMIVCSMVWLLIYNDLYCVLNYILQSLRIIDEPILLMNSADTSLPAVIFMVTWKMAGFSM